MSAYQRAVALVVSVAISVSAAASCWGQRKPTPVRTAPVRSVVELTEKAGKWGIFQAKVGVKMLHDKDYLLSALPRKMIGGTFIARGAAEHGTWLPDGALNAKKDLTAYAIIRVKYLGKDVFDETAQQLLVRDGWTEVEGKVSTTCPSGEGWVWKAFQKDVDQGPVFLTLQELSWSKHETAVLFVFKEREKAKP